MGQAFFNTESPFGESGIWAKWEAQPVNTSTVKQRAQALKKNGDELASALYGTRDNITVNFVIKATGAQVPNAGSIHSGYHIDSIQVVFSQTDYVRMTVNAHKHAGSSHAANSCREYASTLGEIDAVFGCPDEIMACTLPTGTGVRTITYNLTCNHVDEPNSTGGFLAGDNYDGTETVDIELCDTTQVTAATGWDLLTGTADKGPTVAQTMSASLEHHIAHVVAQSQG